MKKPTVKGIGLRAAALLMLTRPVTAHSWIETAYRIAPNGTLVGNVGYPRGYVPRDSTDPVFQDSIPVWLLPEAGQGAYSGDEVLNKFPLHQEPKYPMLEAAAGDWIALLHLENGHTTLPQNQPKKPRNRGTIFFYGTSEPRERERLFDVHLAWNRDGTGGDGRGRLLATRNYDDGQCYQPNGGALSAQRAAELAADGAVHAHELACQSDVRLPVDLAPGSVYTIYWYWDWPDLNADQIDLEATRDGLFPWAGTFMRGERDPHGFSMAAIAKNESYASTIDVRIAEGRAVEFGSKHNLVGEGYVDKQDVYFRAIKEQMESNFQVDLDGLPPSSSSSLPATTTTTTTKTVKQEPTTTVTSRTTMEVTAVRPATQTETAGPATVTVTQVVTVQPATVWRTLTKTRGVDDVLLPSTVVRYVTTHVPAGRPTVTPVDDLVASLQAGQAGRRSWKFGH